MLPKQSHTQWGNNKKGEASVLPRTTRIRGNTLSGCSYSEKYVFVYFLKSCSLTSKFCSMQSKCFKRNELIQSLSHKLFFIELIPGARVVLTRNWMKKSHQFWLSWCTAVVPLKLSGHSPEWTQYRVDTIPNRHNPEWTRSRVGAIPNGHHREWTRSRMHQPK